ncbi:MAG: hypothetical protein KKA73_17060 [Chloroflexi bacterium]|nr:hypothetical protein [Chloroflexota bacterium]MBU1749398.1 hypothetical protein [Chloroflexota bacterium]MBU1880079.1 hypothetical protein [Chloroflexota bacterium]
MWLSPDDPASQRLKQVLKNATSELDPARRQALYREVEQLFCVEACVVAPVYHYTQVWLTKPYLHRDYPALGGQNFKDWRIDPH